MTVARKAAPFGAIVLDTSALVAISREETESAAFIALVETASALHIPASGYLEFTMVTRLDARRRDWLDRMISGYGIAIAPIDEATARLAADAYARFGKGTGHRVRLNFGDCLSYAVAKRLDAALLYKGADFATTDVTAAL